MTMRGNQSFAARQLHQVITSARGQCGVNPEGLGQEAIGRNLHKTPPSAFVMVAYSLAGE